jgi:hypothetical protein
LTHCRFSPARQRLRSLLTELNTTIGPGAVAVAAAGTGMGLMSTAPRFNERMDYASRAQIHSEYG